MFAGCGSTSTSTRHVRRQADLSKVDEIGFADLTPGSYGAGGWADVATLEVYAKQLK
jgi:hypothetical protein